MPTKWQGFTEQLQTGVDLFRKLEHDLERMRKRPDSSYAAFDFFVTAEHMVDWTQNQSMRKTMRKTIPLIQQVSHLANTAKHHETDRWWHQSVKAVRRNRGIFDPAIFDPRIFDVGRLVIERETADPIDAIALAQEVLEFWREQLGLPGKEKPPAK